MKKRKRDLIIVYDNIEDPKSINAQLITSYMNRFIIDEAAQIEIKEIIDYRETSYTLSLNSNYAQLVLVSELVSDLCGDGLGNEDRGCEFFENCFVLSDLYLKLKQAIVTALMPFSPGLWSLFFEKINVIQRNLTNENSYLHYIIGINSGNGSVRFQFLPLWFRHLKQSFGISAQHSSTYFTFLGGKRMDIIEKKEIQEDLKRSSSMLLNSNNNLWNFLKPSKPIRTIGDDIESLFDQMKNGRIQTTKYQLSHSHYMLLEKDLKKVKSSDNDYLYSFLRSFQSQYKKELLDSLDSVFLKCECIRTTLE